MITRSECGIWMDNAERFESVSRMIAIDCMLGLGLDPSDFRTRDRIISSISGRVDRTLDCVLDTAIDSALKAAGIDMEPAKKRLHEMIDAKRKSLR